jgi:hypothetical protein
MRSRPRPAFLPSLKDWLPENHLAWFVLDAVEELDLTDFYADYREDGWGASAHDPKMMVALLIYAYSTGIRTTRQIERHCLEDVAFRVICSHNPLGLALTSGKFQEGGFLVVLNEAAIVTALAFPPSVCLIPLSDQDPRGPASKGACLGREHRRPTHDECRSNMERPNDVKACSESFP